MKRKKFGASSGLQIVICNHAASNGNVQKFFLLIAIPKKCHSFWGQLIAYLVPTSWGLLLNKPIFSTLTEIPARQVASTQ